MVDVVLAFVALVAVAFLLFAELAILVVSEELLVLAVLLPATPIEFGAIELFPGGGGVEGVESMFDI